jgi:hypothetical protein
VVVLETEKIRNDEKNLVVAGPDPRSKNNVIAGLTRNPKNLVIAGNDWQPYKTLSLRA